MGEKLTLMRKLKALLWATILLPALLACNRQALIQNRSTLAALDSVSRIAGHLGMERMNAQLEEVGSLTEAEKEAIRFLYAYMPACDVLDYSLAFHLSNVRSALAAREAMPWGKKVPEEAFLHFVLPVRVNNEHLDSSRILFYEVLKERVAGMTMEQAALEVNHWCRQNVTYAPSDARTHSPLETLKNALGRCGEQSTFTVAALRAVGIPARQVYTPRWAHTDDNHAWVEVWIDGKWHFMGGSEPESTLDRAWFNSASSRAMLVHTKAFGHYANPDEEVIKETANYTEVNCITTYAPTQRVEVKVKAAGLPAADASVAFTIYNYAEFYPAAKLSTDAAGKCALTTGKGDMLVWAWLGDSCGYAVARADALEPLQIDLEPLDKLHFPESLKLTPPMESNFVALKEVTPAMAREHALRMAYDDSVRTAYEATFVSPKEAVEAALQMGCDGDLLSHILLKARGNSRDLLAWCKANPSLRDRALRLLCVMSDKDATDIDTAFLSTWVERMPQQIDDRQLRYQYNPRIENEHLSDWYAAVRELIDEKTLAHFHEQPEAISQLVTSWERIDDTNTNGTLISPRSVIKYGKTDLYSMKLAFVAIARSAGLLARINPQNRRAEIVLPKETDFRAAPFELLEAENASLKGFLSLAYEGKEPAQSINYYTRFSIAQLTPAHPFPATQYYDEEKSSLPTLFGNGRKQPLDAGLWLLTAGTRMANGSVLVRITPFNMVAGVDNKMTLLLPYDENDVSVIGNIDCEQLYYRPNGEKRSILSTTGRGYFVLAILKTGTEPTRHLLHDLEKVKAQLDAWGRPFLFLFPSEQDADAFRSADYPRLPANICYGLDADSSVADMLRAAVTAKGTEWPIIVVADSFGRVVYYRQGYNISTGEEIVLTIPKL